MQARVLREAADYVRRHQLRAWRAVMFPVLSALVAALLLLIVGAVAARQNDRTVWRDGLNRVQSNADAATRAVTRQSADYLQTVRASAASPSLVEALRKPNRRALRAAQEPLATLAVGKDAPAAFLSDLSGRYVAGYPQQTSLVGRSYAYRDWYHGVTTSGRPYVSSGYRSVAPGDPLVVGVAAPVMVDGRPVGYLTVLWQLASIRAVVDGSRRDDGIAVTVVDQRGQPLTSSPKVDERGQTRRAAVLTTTRQALAGGRVNTVQSGDFVAAEGVPSLGWAVTAIVPSSVVMGPARAFRNKLAIAVVVAFVALLVGLLLAVVSNLRRARDAAALQASNERFRNVFDEGLTGKALTDTTGEILRANRALSTLLGTEVAQLRHRRLSNCFRDPADQEKVESVINSKDDEIYSEMALQGADGRELWGRVAARWVINESGQRVLLAQIEDITARRQAEQRLRELALHDELTGLPNRRLLMERCEQLFAVARSGRSGTTVVLLFIDLDGFKAVNDRAGHSAGDQLLRSIAGNLVDTLRPADTVARVGGDEFVVLLGSDEGMEAARTVADRIGHTIRRQVPNGSGFLAVSASIGLARVDLAQEPDVVPEQLLRRADAAMYRAKQRGRDRQDIFDDQLLASTEARYQLEHAVRDGLLHDRIKLVYQPVIDVDSGEVVGAEALMRLHDENGRWLPTLPAIIAAELSGLAEEVGDRVIDLALTALRTWPDHMTVAVNVSARELTGANFRTRVQSALLRHDVNPARVVLEITESSVVHAGRSSLDALQELRASGVRVAIDDFGTAYATLQNLTRLPVDVIKIDSSFTAGLVREKTATAVIHGVITMANALDIPCIVEGIETQIQLQALRGLAVQGQGWLWGKPKGNEAIPSIEVAWTASAAATPTTELVDRAWTCGRS